MPIAKIHTQRPNTRQTKRSARKHSHRVSRETRQYGILMESTDKKLPRRDANTKRLKEELPSN